MRLLIAWTLVAAVFAAVTGNASAAPELPDAPATTVSFQEIDDNDDSRVEVQLVVLGVVFGVVFILGSALYLLRKRLGLVPPPPGEDATTGHH